MLICSHYILKAPVLKTVNEVWSRKENSEPNEYNDLFGIFCVKIIDCPHKIRPQTYLYVILCD